MTYEAHPSRSNWATTSHVIEHLQSTIDSLRRELNEQNARVTEERQGREAIKKRCEISESQLEGIRHENEALNSMISEKEVRVKELEKDIEVQTRQALDLEGEQQEFIESKRKYDAVIKRIKEDKSRSETAHNAAVEGSNSIKVSYDYKFAQINKHLAQLTEDRRMDKSRIDKLQDLIAKQREERGEMEKIKAQMEEEHKVHIKQIAALVDLFKVDVVATDTVTHDKMKETELLVNELERTHLALSRHTDIMEGTATK